MDSGTLLVPLAPDCEAMRQGLIANPLPPVWELDAATARRLHREGTLAARVNWQPDLDALPVSSVDTPASDGLPARRTYRPDGPMTTRRASCGCTEADGPPCTMRNSCLSSTAGSYPGALVLL